MVVYAIVLSIAYKTLTFKNLFNFARETVTMIAPLLFIVCSASLFGWILAYEQIPQKAAVFFIGSFTNKYLALLVINLFLLIVGCFMETAAAITILTPILVPVAISLSIDPVHFGIIMILNLMIGLITPPVGMVLYTLSSVSSTPFERISKATVPYVGVLLIILLILTYIPEISTWLPNLVFG